MSNFWLADCYFHLRDYEKSIDGYNGLSVSGDANLSYYQDLRKYNLAYSYFQTQDYLNAVKFNSTYLRIGSKIFGPRN